MSFSLAEKMADELHRLKYEGAVVWCGYGEPLLHSNLASLIRPFRGLHVEIVTSGDTLNSERINQLIEAGCDFFVISMYDGPEQSDKFRAMFEDAWRGDEYYLLRDRWHTDADDFGLKLTNRAGTVSAGHQVEADASRHCLYLTYSMQVDWNGDVLLCSQDWTKRTRFGSLASQSMLDVWKSTPMMKRRRQLMRGREGLSPCAGCNVQGDLHGKFHADAWRAR